MKRNLLCLLLALCLAVLTTACGGGSGSQNTPNGQSQDASAQSGGAEEDGGYVFLAGAEGYAVSVNADMSQVLAALGEPQSYFEAASCAFEGLDKTYTYSGFVITTRPEKDRDLINSILLTDDSVTTPEGIYIGSTAEDVVAAYGEGSRTETSLSYTEGAYALSFILENDAVISIEYLPA